MLSDWHMAQLTRDQELWALALWVEKHHGTDGPGFIAEKVGELALAGEIGGVELWRTVAERFAQLSKPDGGTSVGTINPH